MRLAPRRSLCLPLTALLWAAVGAGTSHADTPDDRQRRCLTMIAYAEAASEGSLGMLAVMKVVHNRVAHSDFADDICAVALERGQFQPVSERPALRRALESPVGHNLAEVLGASTPTARLVLVEAWRLAGAAPVWPERDPTGGALFFVNPRLMDPRKCPWFADLKRTAVIGEHVFMANYAPGEPRRAPALDCRTAGRDFGRATSLARSQATGPFDPSGPRIASRTATAATLRAWRRTGELARRQAELKRYFKPGWYREG
jgi:hypothetical protein